MLDKRLMMVYNLMPGGVVCDIGTDHCKLCVHAIKEGKAPYAFGTDVRYGPLEAARRTVDEHSLKNKILLFQSDGFRNIPSFVFKRTDVFVIAGMGGELIASMLIDRVIEKPMVLQAMTGCDELCEFLHKNGYNILTRDFCDDGVHLYNAFLVKYDGIERETNYFAGAVKNQAFYKHLNREIERMNYARECLFQAKHPDEKRINEINLKMRLYMEERNESKRCL